MRKWLWIGTLSVAAFSAAGGYWYFTRTTDVTIPERGRVVATVVAPVPKDDSEPSEPGVEPILVDGSRRNKSGEFGDEVGMQPPPPACAMNPGMQQPPRPDRIPGTVPYMPYAEEDEDEVGVEVLRRLKTLLRALDLGRALFKDATEESEPPPTDSPMPDYHDYHQQYCPYQGGHCPAPIRTMPRD